LVAAIWFGAMLLGGCAADHRAGDDAAIARDASAVEVVLDSLHDAASKADGERYFALYAPEAVFLGTDASERWTLDQFRAYAEPLFAKGRGWTYAPMQRHVHVEPNGWAVFDELLTNAKFGTCRGSGSLRRTSAGWKIVQYDLSVPIPNDLLEGFAATIRARERSGPAHPDNSR
jgi:ketosteroid isomerase-like protein